jgi:mRNA capping enzyme/mRNA capping enzyme, catalytic domain/mRNA capping enzyme, C-terminal domain
MEISKATHDKMIDMINLFLSNETYELEGKFKGDVSRDAFTRCIQHCKVMKHVEDNHPETMDVMVRMNSSTYRVSVIGKDKIASVFKTNNLPNSGVQMMRKVPVNGVKSFMVDDLMFKVDLKDEQEVEDKIQMEIGLKFPGLDKGFRFKKRFSYTDSKEGLRYDFTIIRTSRFNGTEFIAHKTMSSSQVLNGKEHFEIEIELLRDDKKTRRTKHGIVNAIVSAMTDMYLRVADEKHFLSSSDKVNVLKSYISLCYGRDLNINDVLKTISLRPKEYFIGPQPVTLERKNLLEPGLGIVSIKQNYTVTEKADGERYLLFVNNDGKCYLINNRLTIKYTGVRLNRTVNSLFDGEYITTDKFGKKAQMFGIFDVYYYNSNNVRSYPLVNDGKSGYEQIDNNDKSRYNIMKQFANQHVSTFESNGIVLFAKEFKFGDILEASSEILQKANGGGYAYKIDGMIYTPKYYAVGGQFLKDVTTNTRTWDMVFKWKPSHDNTIDFLVRYEKDETGNMYIIPKNDKLYKSVNLFVGYNPSIHERLTAKKFLTNDTKQVKSYVPKEFIPDDMVDSSISKAYLVLDENINKDVPAIKIVPRCVSGDAIEDNSIVEFAYNPEQDKTYSEHWVPLRVRHDKTEMLRRFGLSGTANDYKTAINVWTSIQNPVDEDMITGKKIVSVDDIVDEDIYFSSTLDRYKYASLIMKNFHNEYIKRRELIMKMPKGSSLFDIACGKAGDLKKWIDAGFTKVMGIDVFRDNIENRKNGAYARTLEAFQKFKVDTRKHSFVYLTADASQRFTPDYIENINDPDDKQIAKILFGAHKSNQIRDENLMKYNGYMKNGFDVISCQFAIHYFFETENTLDNFIYNVDTYLKKGGYLIGTCLDGYRVKEKLQGIKKGQEIQGQIDDRILWNIKKLYSNNKDIKLGEQIEIYMESIGKPIKEFLVDFNLLKLKLSEKGIDVLTQEDCKVFGIESSIDSFQYSFNKVLTSGENSMLAKDIRNMTEVEKEYSFLNSWFIFKKY